MKEQLLHMHRCASTCLTRRSRTTCQLTICTITKQLLRMRRCASTGLTRRSRTSCQLTMCAISKQLLHMRRFASTTKKQDYLSADYLDHKLTTTAHAQVCFDLFDTKKQDYLSADDLDEIMRAMGFRPSKEELQVNEWIFKYDFFLCLCITPA
jgi:hypothetical protein